MLVLVIINTIVCVVGTLAGVVVASGSVISIADMNVPWAIWLLMAAFLIPVMFVVSGIGVWIAYFVNHTQSIIGVIVLPWVYSVVFVILMLLSFKRLH